MSYLTFDSGAGIVSATARRWEGMVGRDGCCALTADGGQSLMTRITLQGDDARYVYGRFSCSHSLHAIAVH